MTETYDVTLAGDGYMVKPGSYRRQQAWASEGKVGRVRLADFYGGARRAFQNERDRFWTGVGAAPAYDSQGVTAGPKRQDRTETPATAIAPGDKRWSFAYNGTTYLVSGACLYSVSTAGGLISGLTVVQALAATVVDAAMVGTTMYFAFGAGTKVASYNVSTSTYTAAPTITVNGAGAQREARLLGVEGAGLVLVLATDDLTLSTGSAALGLGAYIRRLVQHDGHCWAVTDRGLWRMTSVTAVTQESSLQRLGYTDDAVWAVSHLGVLYLWAGRSVLAYGSRSDAVRDLGLPGSVSARQVGLSGTATYGACSVGKWLLVSVVNAMTGLCELWGHDGRGWWLVDSEASAPGGGEVYKWPVSLLGCADDADVLAGRGSTSQHTAVWQLVPRAGALGLRGSWRLDSPLLDAGARDLEKVWRRAGVELVAPEGGATANGVTVQLQYSTDAGGSFTTVTSATYTSGFRSSSLEAGIAALPQAKAVQLRVNVSGVVDWCPVISSVWVEHETLDVPTRRRRWAMTLLCNDHVVKRDGSVDTTGARALALRLWGAWDDGAPVSFKDVDYDLSGSSYTVRVSQIEERLDRQQRAATFASSEVMVTLIEV